MLQTCMISGLCAGTVERHLYCAEDLRRSFIADAYIPALADNHRRLHKHPAEQLPGSGARRCGVKLTQQPDLGSRAGEALRILKTIS